MERYEFSDAERMHLERLPSPLAVYQLVDKHYCALILSDGFCEMFGFPDKAEAYRLTNPDVFYNIHPDDTGRIRESARRFAQACRKVEACAEASGSRRPPRRGW